MFGTPPYIPNTVKLKLNASSSHQSSLILFLRILDMFSDHAKDVAISRSVNIYRLNYVSYFLGFDECRTYVMLGWSDYTRCIWEGHFGFLDSLDITRRRRHWIRWEKYNELGTEKVTVPFFVTSNVIIISKLIYFLCKFNIFFCYNNLGYWEKNSVYRCQQLHSLFPEQQSLPNFNTKSNSVKSEVTIRRTWRNKNCWRMRVNWRITIYWCK